MTTLSMGVPHEEDFDGPRPTTVMDALVLINSNIRCCTAALEDIATSLVPHKDPYVAATTENFMLEIDEAVDQSSHAYQQKKLVHVVANQLRQYGQSDISQLDAELVARIKAKHSVCTGSCCRNGPCLFDSAARFAQHRGVFGSRKRDKAYNPAVATADDDDDATEPYEPVEKKRKSDE